MRFWLEIAGNINDQSDMLWKEIEQYNVNLLVLDNSAFIYGRTQEFTLKEIIYLCTLLGFPVSLTIEK